MEETDDLEDSIKISANELLAFQRELKQEKELLQKILTKIDDQVHRLQVEQLHLLGLMNKSLKGTTENSSSYEPENDIQQESTNKSLDLSVASAFKHFEEEIEDEDDI